MLLTRQQAAEHLLVSVDTLMNEVNKGRIIGFKIASVWRFDIRDLDEYIDKQRDNAVEKSRAIENAEKAKMLSGNRNGISSKKVWTKGKSLNEYFPELHL